ncbi:MAG TPA: energy transducer TonB [Methylomirabilota bacterium]|nr:energy transducer TonB [Methylomirabilota bacterium]
MTETAIRFRDDPWPRLRWLVPAALGLTLVSQMAFLSLLRLPASPPTVPRPVDVQVIELPAPPASARPAPPERRSSPPPRRLDAPSPRPVLAPSEPRIEVPRAPAPPVAEEPVTPAPAATVPAPPAPSPPSAGPSTQVPLTALPPSRGPQDATLGGTDSMSARAIYKPMSEIPEALRRRTIDMVAVARFRVDAAGRAQVELVEPTPDPDLNRALLESLQRWRFFPATQAGRPVASTIDVRIPVSVK